MGIGDFRVHAALLALRLHDVLMACSEIPYFGQSHESSKECCLDLTTGRFVSE